MKKIIIGINNGSLTSPNLGVQALTYSSMQLLIELSQIMNFQIAFYLFDSYKKLDSNVVQIGDVQVYCESNVFNMTKKIFWDKNFRLYILSNWMKCDLIWDIGGGDSWSDIYGKKRFYVSFLSIFKLIQLRKPVILPPQTIGPFKNRLVKVLANYIMRKCLNVYPRDGKSAKYLVSNLTERNFLTIPDMALFLPFKKNDCLSKEFINIGVNVSGLLYNGGYTRDNQFSLKANYQQLINDIVSWFSKMENVKIYLIPHVIEEIEGKVEDDVWACLEVKKNFPSTILPSKFLNPMDAKSFISGLDFFLGARMHSAIAAFSSGVPVIPMAYSRKFSGLFCDTLNYNHLVDLKAMNNEEILTIIKNDFNRRGNLKIEIGEINNKLQHHKEAFFKSLNIDFKHAKLI